MSNPLISIIVPVYNVEKYLDKCVESIVNQTYKNLEIILVDDGSPDNCPTICDKWLQKDDRIKVIHKLNGGVSSARNEGIRNTLSEYLMFIDSDDEIEKDMVHKLFTSLSENGSDVSVCNMNFVNETGDILYSSDFPAKVCTENIVTDYLADIYGIGPCNKLYRADIIKNNSILFDTDLIYGEDNLFNYHYFKLCKKVSVIDDKLYNYFITNEGSSTYGLTKGYLNSWRLTKRLMNEEIENKENYIILLNKYFDQLAVIAAKLSVCSDSNLVNEYYPIVINEIQSNYDLFSDASNLSKLRALSIKIIRFSPNLFKRLFRIYSKMIYKR